MTGDTLLGDEGRGQSQCIQKTSKAATHVKKIAMEPVKRGERYRGYTGSSGLHRYCTFGSCVHDLLTPRTVFASAVSGRVFEHGTAALGLYV